MAWNVSCVGVGVGVLFPVNLLSACSMRMTNVNINNLLKGENRSFVYMYIHIYTHMRVRSNTTHNSHTCKVTTVYGILD